MLTEFVVELYMVHSHLILYPFFLYVFYQYNLVADLVVEIV